MNMYSSPSHLSPPNYGYVTSTPVAYPYGASYGGAYNNAHYMNSQQMMASPYNLYGGYYYNGCSFPYNNQFFMNSGNMNYGWGMGYSEVARQAESKIESYPYQSYYIDYIQQQYIQSVLVPYKRKKVGYYAVQHITDYEPREYQETIIDMIPEQRIRERLQYLPVQTHIVHYPDENKPVHAHTQYKNYSNQGAHVQREFLQVPSQPVLRNTQNRIPVQTSQQNIVNQQQTTTKQVITNQQINTSQNTIPRVVQKSTINTFQAPSQQSIPPQTGFNRAPNDINAPLPPPPTNINRAPNNSFLPSAPPPPPTNLNNPSSMPFHQKQSFQSGQITDTAQISKTYEKYPPPHGTQGQLAGGSIKSHHRVITSKPLNQSTDSQNVLKKQESSGIEKKNSTVNLVNLVNQSVNQQLSTPSGSVNLQNSFRMGSGSFSNSGLPPPPPPPTFTTKKSSGSETPLGFPRMQQVISNQSSSLPMLREYSDPQQNDF